MKYLIVSADDFGISESINRGIIDGFKDGIVTAMHVIPSGKAFYEGMADLRILKPPEICAHLALTETSSVTEPDKIPSLVTKSGNFYKNYTDFLPRYFSGAVQSSSIYIELKNQMERLKSSGIPIKCLSSHQHIHMIPGILQIFKKLAKEYDVPAIRYLRPERMYPPFKFQKVFKNSVLAFFKNRTREILDASGIRHADNFAGLLDSGNVREEVLLRLIRDLPEGITELVTHPGFLSSDVMERCIFHLNCETDLAALTSPRVKSVLKAYDIKLISFGEMCGMR